MRSVSRITATVRARSRARLNAYRRGVTIGRGARFGKGVRCVSSPDAQLILGDEVEVADGTTLVAMPGATLILGDRVFVGGGCTIAAASSVSIGEESMLAELVSIRDHDHDPAFPPRSGHRLIEDIDIGARVWIGAKATITRGTRIGDDAVIGAHALVNKPVPAESLAAGVPAKVIRDRIRTHDT